MGDDELLDLLHRTATAVRESLVGLGDWGLEGASSHQYHHDVVSDAAALSVLDDAGVGVLSEESGVRRPAAPITVVVDPVDGSTNASRGVPWWNTSLCAVDADGPRAAVVADQVHGVRFEAVRGGGARRDGVTIRPTGCDALREAFIGLSGFPPRYLGWSQYRTLGAAALDLCAVACGVLDGYMDCSRRGHGPWDYLGGLLVCREAGALVADADGDELVTIGHADRRTPVAAATPALLDALLTARRGF